MKNEQEDLTRDEEQAFNVGYDVEQTMAESILDNEFIKKSELVDEAFLGAFNGLIVRMLRFVPKETLFEIIELIDEDKKINGDDY